MKLYHSVNILCITYNWTSLVAQIVKTLPAMLDTRLAGITTECHNSVIFVVVIYSLSGVWLFCDSTDCSPPGSSVHGILQARILEWVATPSSRGSSQPRDPTHISCTAGRFFTTEPRGKLFYYAGQPCYYIYTHCLSIL